MFIDFFKEEEYQEGYSTEDSIIIGSGIVALVMIIIGSLSYTYASGQLGIAIFILGILIILIPYAIISFLKNRAIKQMEDQFPSFLRGLAESKRGGMTIINAFESAKETDYGRLNHEIEKVYNQLTWGVPFPEVMERFSRRMEESPVIQESLSILLQSFESGGNVTRTIESIAQDSADLKETVQKKNSQIKQQVIIMYVIYFLFIGIMIGLYSMLSQLLGLGDPSGGALDSLGSITGGGTDGAKSINYCGGQITASAPLCEIAKVFGFVPANVSSFSSSYARKFSYGNMAYYKSLLFSMLMVQGIATSAVAGQISDGSPSSGIKHALVLLPIAFVAFMITVGLAGV